MAAQALVLKSEVIKAATSVSCESLLFLQPTTQKQANQQKINNKQR